MGTGGFYYVETSLGLLETKARGIFRRQGVSPCAGDLVTVEMDGQETGTITAIADRKNYFVRPALANLDRLLLVVSTADPVPNLQIIDRMTAISVLKGIETVLVFTKTDLSPAVNLCEIYKLAGFVCVPVDYQSGAGLDQLRALTGHGLSAVIGNTGVGKSTLLNALYPDFQLKTGETSRKLGRGRHTTRTVQLFHAGNGLLADTPGFSTVDVSRYEWMAREDVQHAFPEFAPYLEKCQFTGCSHRVEKGCAVLEAMKKGLVAASRHESYRLLYEEAMTHNEWERKENKRG